ncbi:sulfite exporter TauE/SafE family protein [Geomicrobium sp. JCM 19038]|uniref:sulfite exporter TauE/SafE family protein n=1 Tax=Geomicrobium sp. JCM 19038 TaxID=1460635 RepID=UPI00045F4B95|nr:sulfite exporter TauE/SafE family protein [Geomicrobium sp. JCM 19038]GAK10105.1 membrane protein [Geomicrobium sp. JCM 19038]
MELLAFFSIVFVAAILQTSTGFGFSILATPFLLLLFDPVVAIQINLVLSLIISFCLYPAVKGGSNKSVLLRLWASAVVGLPVGIFILQIMHVDALKAMIAVLMIILTILLLNQISFAATRSREYVVGGISGVLTSSIGMPGPPLLIYLSGTGASKAYTRATTLTFFLGVYSVTIVAQMMTIGTEFVVWEYSLYALPVVLLGLFIGKKLYPKLNAKVFQMIVYGLLLFTASYLLIEVLFL